MSFFLGKQTYFTIPYRWFLHLLPQAHFLGAHSCFVRRLMQSSPHQVDSSSGQVFVVIKREARKYIVHTGVKGARADVRSLERGLSAKEIDVELDQRDSLESGIDDLLVSSRVLFNNGDGSLESKQDNNSNVFPVSSPVQSRDSG